MRPTATSAARSSTSPSLRILHECPQCGGPVDLEETDRLLTCGYCRVRLQIAGPGPRRLLLPPKDPFDPDLFYIPYWRIKGQVLTCTSSGLVHSIVDRTFRAIEDDALPLTLGFRPQAMRLRFATPETQGRFLAPSVTLETAVAATLRSLRSPLEESRIFETLLGETMSVVHLPVILRDGILDAVVGAPLTSADRLLAARRGPLAAAGRRVSAGGGRPLDAANQIDRENLGVQFLPTLCPECGWSLIGERDSLVLVCPTCRTAWEADDRRWSKVALASLPGVSESARLLPFWRIRASIEGLSLRTRVDLVRLGNLPETPGVGREDGPLHFWSPAFKLHPEHYLRIAATMTLARPEPSAEANLESLPIHPVTLARNEAIDAVRVIVARMARPARPVMSRLAGARIDVEEATLVCVPFESHGSDLIQHAIPLCVNRNLLEHGRHI
ncbi:MAG: hypothetical protein FJY88_02260 [Candidatus Eisenbacteria bacterium]|nr:hypothetical protein [Candidatus Eisenbacteria bacterium]